MKKSFVILVCTLIMLSIISGSVMAAETNVRIAIKENNVADMYYQVVKDGEPVGKVEYKVKDETGNTIYEGETKDSILYLEHVPFGKYSICIYEEKEYVFERELDEEYVKNQHKLKILELKEESVPKTGDLAKHEIEFYLGIEILTMLLSFWILKRRRREI